MFSNLFVYIIYVLFGAVLLAGSKIYSKGEWNNDVMSFKHSKAFLGFCALGIVLHHCAQTTCAPWLVPPHPIKNGLDMFLYLGYLFVAAFFFCSGYGMYKSNKKKTITVKKFLLGRLLTIMIPTVASWLIFLLIRYLKHMKIEFTNPFLGDGPKLIHPFIWYIPVFICLNIFFFLFFSLIKKDAIAIPLMLLATVGVAIFLSHFNFGSWWYNSHHLFVIGIIYSKFEDKILSFFKKTYIPSLIISIIIFFATFLWANYFWDICFAINKPLYETMNYVAFTYFMQLISALFFVIVTLLVGMKIEIGNPVLHFLGKLTLELYLFQAIFVYMFSFTFFEEYFVKPVYYIKDVALYTVVVVITSVLAAYLFSLFSGLILRKVKK